MTALEVLSGSREGPAEATNLTMASLGFELIAPQAAEPPPPPPSKGELAVAAAKAQIGRPYRYGSTGPSSFDCSGLTSFAWRAAGVEIPRTSRAQFSGLPRVGLDQLQPGDLVYGPGHIGLYIGDGLMVHAPQTGRNVEIAPMRHGVIGAVRPG
jgi:cell wall-associated NlpC family hydrolase